MFTHPSRVCNTSTCYWIVVIIVLESVIGQTFVSKNLSSSPLPLYINCSHMSPSGNFYIVTEFLPIPVKNPLLEQHQLSQYPWTSYITRTPQSSQNKAPLFRRSSQPQFRSQSVLLDPSKSKVVTSSSDHLKSTSKCRDLIATYMEDNKKVNQSAVIPQRWHSAQTLLTQGLLDSLLRDEIYCQICKQLTQYWLVETTTRENDAYRRGWELLSFVIHTFAPSKDLALYLFAKLHTFIENETLDVDVWSAPQFCLDSLCKTVVLPSRKFVPTFHELEAIKLQTSQTIDVHFVYELEDILDESRKNNCGIDPGFSWNHTEMASRRRGGVSLRHSHHKRSKTVTLDSFTSAYEVCKEMLRHLGLLEHSGIFGLYEVQGNLERIVWPDERISDIICKWENYTLEGDKPSEFYLFFKQQIFINPKEELHDEIITLLTYHSVCNGIWGV
jgi:hypothetical protein